MKNFYEMLQILEKAKLNEGRKYLAHYASSNEINIGEKLDYYSWEGKINIGYERDDDEGYLFPVAWAIDGDLIKYKENKDGTTVFNEKDEPVVDKVFENPGLHGQNIPEPYKSGSDEVTGFNQIIKSILEGELEDVNGNNDDEGYGRRSRRNSRDVITNPDYYDWKEFDGTMHEEPDVLLPHHKKITHDGKEITLGKVDDYSPKSLPWYRNENAIPPQDLEEAKKVAKQETLKRHGDQKEYEWRLSLYINARTGYSGNSFYGYGHDPWHVMDHNHALEYMTKWCLHDWVKERDHSESNPYLGTWRTGVYYICKKCGERKYETTGEKNYSGD